MPESSKWSSSLRFPHQSPVCTSPLPHPRHMSCPSQSSWLDHPNDIWWGVQSMKLLVNRTLHINNIYIEAYKSEESTSQKWTVFKPWRDVDILVLNLNIRWWWVVSFRLLLLYTWGKRPRYLPNMYLDGLLNRSGGFRKETIILPLPGIKPHSLAHPIRSLIAVPNTVFRL
jgi:hypothetical protein